MELTGKVKSIEAVDGVQLFGERMPDDSIEVTVEIGPPPGGAGLPNGVLRLTLVQPAAKVYAGKRVKISITIDE
jgi:hypothetical protein